MSSSAPARNPSRVPGPISSTYQVALQLLARRELSTAQLRDRLTRRKLPAFEIEAAITRLTRERAVAEVFDAVDEEAVLERAIAKRLDGPIRDRAQFRRLYQALVRQGFPPDRIAAALVVHSQKNAGMEE